MERVYTLNQFHSYEHKKQNQLTMYTHRYLPTSLSTHPNLHPSLVRAYLPSLNGGLVGYLVSQLCLLLTHLGLQSLDVRLCIGQRLPGVG